VTPPDAKTSLPGQDAILARVCRYQNGVEDLFGFRQGVLIPYLRPETVRQIFPNVSMSEFDGIPLDLAGGNGAEYLMFTFGKAGDHRGMSAGRSVQKLEEFAWLAGRPDVVDAMQAAPYVQYGVPKLLVYAAGFGLPIPGDEALARMGRGEPCQPGCQSGCNR